MAEFRLAAVSAMADVAEEVSSHSAFGTECGSNDYLAVCKTANSSSQRLPSQTGLDTVESGLNVHKTEAVLKQFQVKLQDSIYAASPLHRFLKKKTSEVGTSVSKLLFSSQVCHLMSPVLTKRTVGCLLSMRSTDEVRIVHLTPPRVPPQEDFSVELEIIPGDKQFTRSLSNASRCNNSQDAGDVLFCTESLRLSCDEHSSPEVGELDKLGQSRTPSPQNENGLEEPGELGQSSNLSPQRMNALEIPFQPKTPFPQEFLREVSWNNKKIKTGDCCFFINNYIFYNSDEIIVYSNP